MKSDLHVRKTEGEWAEFFLKVWLKLTPLWFDWLGWLLLLGAIKFLADETNSFLVFMIYRTSFVLLYSYMVSLVMNVDPTVFRHIKSRRARLAAVLLFALIVTRGAWLLLEHLVDVVRATM